MKSIKSIIFILLFCLVGTQASEAQFFKRLGEKAEKAAERAIRGMKPIGAKTYAKEFNHLYVNMLNIRVSCA